MKLTVIIALLSFSVHAAVNDETNYAACSIVSRVGSPAVSFSVSLQDWAIGTLPSLPQSPTSGHISKEYLCGKVFVAFEGDWDYEQDFHHDRLYYKEFGEFWFDEKGSFGVYVPTKRKYTGCHGPSGFDSNNDGYMSETIVYRCTEADVTLKGKWGQEFQGHWSYSLQLGEVSMEPQWVADVRKDIEFSDFQKWCPTKYGYRLCGWIDRPKVDHGIPPALKREKAGAAQ